MRNFDDLVHSFMKFPGVGRRQAQRFVYFLLRKGSSHSQALANELNHLHTNVRQCSESFQFFYSDDPSETRSPIARDPSRDRAIIMIVEKDTDIDAIEKSGVYQGTYFVLGGLVSALNEKIRRAHV